MKKCLSKLLILAILSSFVIMNGNVYALSTQDENNRSVTTEVEETSNSTIHSKKIKHTVNESIKVPKPIKSEKDKMRLVFLVDLSNSFDQRWNTVVQPGFINMLNKYKDHPNLEIYVWGYSTWYSSRDNAAHYSPKYGKTPNTDIPSRNALNTYEQPLNDRINSMSNALEIVKQMKTIDATPTGASLVRLADELDKNFSKGEINDVILVTDGFNNMDISSKNSLFFQKSGSPESMIKEANDVTLAAIDYFKTKELPLKFALNLSNEEKNESSKSLKAYELLKETVPNAIGSDNFYEQENINDFQKMIESYVSDKAEESNISSFEFTDTISSDYLIDTQSVLITDEVGHDITDRFDIVVDDGVKITGNIVEDTLKEVNITYGVSRLVQNTPPTIKTSEKIKWPIHKAFDPLKDVDVEFNDNETEVTSSLEVVSNNVNVSVPGIYKVEYKVNDEIEQFNNKVFSSGSYRFDTTQTNLKDFTYSFEIRNFIAKSTTLVEVEEEPMKPVNPVKPVDPVDPVDPTDPINPVDPVEPIEPIKPVVPDEPKISEELPNTGDSSFFYYFGWAISLVGGVIVALSFKKVTEK